MSDEVNSGAATVDTAPEDLDEENLGPFTYAMFQHEMRYFIENTRQGNRVWLVDNQRYDIVHNQVYIDFITWLRDNPNNRRDLIRHHATSDMVHQFIHEDTQDVFEELGEVLESLTKELKYPTGHMERVIERAGKNHRLIKRIKESL
jgi:hypothetical protein